MGPRQHCDYFLKIETTKCFGSSVTFPANPTTEEQDTFPVNLLLLIG
jgi:hypothetical protein